LTDSVKSFSNFLTENEDYQLPRSKILFLL
jgi:hypothetical protein